MRQQRRTGHKQTNGSFVAAVWKRVPQTRVGDNLNISESTFQQLENISVRTIANKTHHFLPHETEVALVTLILTVNWSETLI